MKIEDWISVRFFELLFRGIEDFYLTRERFKKQIQA